MNKFAAIPIVEWIDHLVDYLRVHGQWLFKPIDSGLNFIVMSLAGFFQWIPAWLFILALTGLSYYLTKKKGLTALVFLGFLYILNQGFWADTMLTLALILTSALISILIGVPLGIWMAKKEGVNKVVTPILDFMQTMPAFVYLIPAVSFFGIGMVPGIIASIIFAMPPVTRLTSHGIRQVDGELIEAADAFGSTGSEKLFKVELPLAKKTIMQGINQTIMLALSMVVIASMIGAEGLGTQVYQAITRNEAGQGFAAGLGIVILAIILDRLVQALNAEPSRERRAKKSWLNSPGKKALVGLGVLVLIFGLGAYQNSSPGAGGQDRKIIGIEPGAGIMDATERTIKDYDLPYRLQSTSSAAMTQTLGDAIKDKKEIIVTGWSPHWMFQKYDLKYLEDPKNTFGDAETINTIVKVGLKEEKPNAYQFLDKFYWTVDDMESVMVDMADGKSPQEAAKIWLDKNQDKVQEWTQGINTNSGESLELAYVAWDTEVASTNVVKAAMEANGFKVKITQVEAGPMWNAMAASKVDGMVCAWLPVTQKQYYEDLKDRLVDLGPNLEGAKSGLVVPAYSDLNSIEDLK